ncbi:MAG: hypothetical protein VX028_04580 [Nanoarchaeota archaeon]|nr:hypothetical protein [Nanoarchaeota archaeon]
MYLSTVIVTVLLSQNPSNEISSSKDISSLLESNVTIEKSFVDSSFERIPCNYLGFDSSSVTHCYIGVQDDKNKEKLFTLKNNYVF